MLRIPSRSNGGQHHSFHSHLHQQQQQQQSQSQNQQPQQQQQHISRRNLIDSHRIRSLGDRHKSSFVVVGGGGGKAAAQSPSPPPPPTQPSTHSPPTSLYVPWTRPQQLPRHQSVFDKSTARYYPMSRTPAAPAPATTTPLRVPGQNITNLMSAHQQQRPQFLGNKPVPPSSSINGILTSSASMRTAVPPSHSTPTFHPTAKSGGLVETNKRRPIVSVFNPSDVQHRLLQWCQLQTRGYKVRSFCIFREYQFNRKRDI